MILFGWNPEIWVYWLLHGGLIIGYGIYILTRKKEDKWEPQRR